MKRVFLCCLVIFLSLNTFAQSKTLAKFRITEATDDGEDVTEWHFQRKQQIVFYRCDDGSLCLSNFRT